MTEFFDTGPHRGLRVLDLSDRLSGAFAARLFADFGAQVLLAEPRQGHVLRHEGPHVAEVSSIHEYANWNKSSIAFEQLEDLYPLISEADVIVVCQPKLVTELKPQLKGNAVLLVLTAHGSSGELAAYPGNNLTTSARTGWAYINRLRDEPPLQMPRHQSGYIGGIAGYIAASAAIFRRYRTDRAEQVDVSEVEAFAHTVHPWAIMSIYANQSDAYGPAGWRPRGALNPLWPAKGGPMHLAIGDFHNWTEAMMFLGLPDIANDPELIPSYGRHGRDLRHVVDALGDVLPKMDRWEIFHGLARLRCVVGVVQNMRDLYNNAQIAEREFLVATEAGGKQVKAPGAIAKFESGTWSLRADAPSKIGGGSGFVETQTLIDSGDKRNFGMSAKGPLSGCRVLSFGQAWSGTFATEVLALLGADVVQIGGIQRPDVWRRVRTEVPEGVRDANKNQHPLNTSALYNSVNMNKRELTLNMKEPRGIELFWQLVPGFDILLDNFRATVMPGWGVTLQKLNELRPGIVWASISGYGSEGPFSDFPANGATTEPMSGFSSLHGYEGDEGMNTAGLYPDPASGYVLAAAILAALHHRDQTGLPQRVDLSMMEAVAVLCGDAFVEFGLSEKLPTPMGNRHPTHAPHGYFKCLDDEWIAIAVETSEQWLGLVSIVGDNLSAPRWMSAVNRKADESVLDELLSVYCANKDVKELERNLSDRGVIAARVVPLLELYSHTNNPLHRSGFIQTVEHAEAGASYLPGSPWHFSESADLRLKAAPRVGEHSAEILAQELGIRPDQYKELVSAGITGTIEEHIASKATKS